MLQQTKVFILFLLAILLTGKTFGQDIFFSQYYSAPLSMNPAFAGTAGCLRTGTNYRLQWPLIRSGIQSSSAYADVYFKGFNGGLGLMQEQFSSSSGAFRMAYSSLIYAQQIHSASGKFVVVPSLQITLVKSSIDWASFTFGDQIDRRRGFTWFTSQVYPDSIQTVKRFAIGSGLLVYTKHLDAGLAVKNINTPDVGFITTSRLPVLITLHGAWYLKALNAADKGWNFSPSFVCTKSLDFYQFVLAAMVKYNKCMAGLAYRKDVGAIASVGFKNGFMKAGYSYDFPFTTILANTGGTHEISLQFLLFKSALQKENRLYCMDAAF